MQQVERLTGFVLIDVHAIRLKVDTGSDTIAMTTEDSERLQFATDVKSSSYQIRRRISTKSWKFKG